MKTRVAYASLTGNTERFVAKIAKLRPDWEITKITRGLVVNEPYHLIIYTIGNGVVPRPVQEFLSKNSKRMLSVSSGGNMNYGPNFAIAATYISQKYNVPSLLRFEQAGQDSDVDFIIKRIEEVNENVS